MKPIRNRLSWVCKGWVPDPEGVVAGDDGARVEERRRVARFLTLTSSGRSLED